MITTIFLINVYVPIQQYICTFPITAYALNINNNQNKNIVILGTWIVALRKLCTSVCMFMYVIVQYTYDLRNGAFSRNALFCKCTRCTYITVMERNYTIKNTISNRLLSCEVSSFYDDLFRYNYAGSVSRERCIPVRPQQHTQIVGITCLHTVYTCA